MGVRMVVTVTMVMPVMQGAQNLRQAHLEALLVHRAQRGHGDAALAGFDDKRFDVLLAVQKLGQAGNPGFVEQVWCR